MASVWDMYNHREREEKKYANCTDGAWHSFDKEMKQKLWQVDGLLLVSGIMAGLSVGIGVYGQRYRHHPFSRLIFLGATTLFLPIISSVVSLSAVFDSSVIPLSVTDFSTSAPALIAVCGLYEHSFLVITWALLVQNVMINTSVVVAIDDREGTVVGPPIELLPQWAWILYLCLSYMHSTAGYRYKPHLIVGSLLEVLLFLLTLAKLLFKYYAVRQAQQSFAFGRNPRLVSGYMQQLPVPLTAGEHALVPPPLLVMGEETRHVEKQPQGYVFKATGGLVTIDRVWQLLDNHYSNSMLLPLPAPTSQMLKDLCLSFALFKVLRCRFARYDLAYASSQNTSNFFWRLLLSDGEPADRVFGVIADELSFLHDYYNSSLPISYSKCWLPILGIIISLFSIFYCVILALWIMMSILVEMPQIICSIRCKIGDHKQVYKYYGSVYYDMVPLSMLLVFVMAAEVMDIATYVCSNWTKVVLTCRLLPNVDQSLSMRKWTVHVLRWRYKLMKHFWDDRMGQCSVLPLCLPRSTPVALLRHLLHLPDYKSKVDASVKVSIIDALRSSRNENDGALHLSNGKASLCRSAQEGGESFLWACSSRSVSDSILAWQIATSILEVRYPLQLRQQGSSYVTSDRHRSVATNLSRYCVYLVTCCPELLPDHDVWSKSLSKAVRKDAEHALAHRYFSCGSASTWGYQELVDLLSANSKHQVVKDGVKLGMQMVEIIREEDAVWKLLAAFWSEMILYVAPSDNLKGHKVAIARGGELITLLWALLNHVGVVSRTTGDTAGAPAAGGTSSAGVV